MQLVLRENNPFDFKFTNPQGPSQNLFGEWAS